MILIFMEYQAMKKITGFVGQLINSLGLSLERTAENIEVIFNQQEKQNSQFPIFKFECDDVLETYYLIGNKHENQQLIEEQKHVDFFLWLNQVMY